MEVLGVSGVIHDGHLDGRALLLCIEIDDVVEEVRTTAVDVAHEVLQAAFAVEHFLPCVALFVRTHVGQRNGDAGVQISQLTHTVGQNVIFICSGREDSLVGPELLTCAAQFGCTDDFNTRHGFADAVLLLIDLAVAIDLADHLGRKSIHTAHADAVQTTRDLVRALVELTTGMQYCHHDFEGALVLLLVHIDGNATTVVLNGNAVVFVDGYFDVCAIACQSFVNRVIDGLIHEVVQALLADVADVHGRAFTYGFQSFQHLYVRGTVFLLFLFDFFHGV